MRIGAHVLRNNLFVAPMAGVTDRPFRQLCKELGAGYAVSEMAASNPRVWASEKTARRINHDGEMEPKAVQIAGAFMARTTLAQSGASGIRIYGTGGALLLASLYVYLHAAFFAADPALRNLLGTRSARPALVGAVLITLGGVWWYLALPASALGQNREHQQMFADLRMLQEQVQQLRLAINTLADTVKAVTAKQN